MSTSRSNDLSRPWSETNFSVSDNEDNIILAQKILENNDNWKNKYAYAEIGYKINKLSKKEMIMLISEDLDLPEQRKIFKLAPGRKLVKLLLGADVMQLAGKKNKKKIEK